MGNRFIYKNKLFYKLSVFQVFFLLLIPTQKFLHSSQKQVHCLSGIPVVPCFTPFQFTISPAFTWKPSANRWTRPPGPTPSLSCFILGLFDHRTDACRNLPGIPMSATWVCNGANILDRCVKDVAQGCLLSFRRAIRRQILQGFSESPVGKKHYYPQGNQQQRTACTNLNPSSRYSFSLETLPKKTTCTQSLAPPMPSAMLMYASWEYSQPA